MLNSSEKACWQFGIKMNLELMTDMCIENIIVMK